MVEKPLVKAGLPRHLGVKRRAEQSAVLDGNNAAVIQRRENSDLGPHFVDHGCTNEDGVHGWLTQRGHGEVCLERVELSAESVATHGDIKTTPRLLTVDRIVHSIGQHDEPRTSAVHRHSLRDARAQRFGEPEQATELVHDARLTTRNHEPTDLGKLSRRTYFAYVGTQSSQDRDMLAHVALQSEDADGRKSPTSHVRRGGAAQANRPR